jgi:transposase
MLKMARAYSDDLRRKLLEAYDSGKGSLRQLAGVFGVSVEWAFKISAARRRTGKMERIPQSRNGRVSRVDRDKVVSLLEARPDLVLHELQSELEAATGVRISRTQLWRVVQALGFRLKKSPSTPPNAIRTRTGSGA